MSALSAPDLRSNSLNRLRTTVYDLNRSNLQGLGGGNLAPQNGMNQGIIDSKTPNLPHKALNFKY